MARIAILLGAIVLQCSTGNAMPLLSAVSEETGSIRDVRTDFGFDYMHLVQEWPGSFCDEKRGCLWPKYPPEQGGFLLHGLWPEFLNGSWPQFCDSSHPYNASAIRDLLPELHKFWPSLVSPNQDSFWAHEWNKHGTCCERLIGTERNYFGLVLFLRSKFDAASTLAKAGIKPAPRSEVEVVADPQVPGTTTWRAVKRALDAEFGQPLEVGCSRDKTGRVQLAEVRSCYAPVSPGEALRGDELQVGGIAVRKLKCPKEASFASCHSPDYPILFPVFHPAAAA